MTLRTPEQKNKFCLFNTLDQFREFTKGINLDSIVQITKCYNSQDDDYDYNAIRDVKVICPYCCKHYEMKAIRINKTQFTASKCYHCGKIFDYSKYKDMTYTTPDVIDMYYTWKTAYIEAFLDTYFSLPERVLIATGDLIDYFQIEKEPNK